MQLTHDQTLLDSQDRGNGSGKSSAAPSPMPPPCPTIKTEPGESSQAGGDKSRTNATDETNDPLKDANGDVSVQDVSLMMYCFLQNNFYLLLLLLVPGRRRRTTRHCDLHGRPLQLQQRQPRVAETVLSRVSPVFQPDDVTSHLGDAAGVTVPTGGYIFLINFFCHL